MIFNQFEEMGNPCGTTMSPATPWRMCTRPSSAR